MDERTIDITRIDTKNESLKLKNRKEEKKLLSSIAERGVDEPLVGFFNENYFILIDGFKRYRCCKKLHINNLFIKEIAFCEADAFINALKISNSKSLHVLEQAKFIEKLKDDHGMTTTDIAHSLNKSIYWASTRLTLLNDLTPFLEEKIFLGKFPVWNAIGILHQLKRSKIATNAEIDEFVKRVSGKGLSVKDINLLACGYFKSNEEIKAQINNGNLLWCIAKMKDFNKNECNFKENEKQILKDLEISSKYIGRIIFKFPKLQKSNNFNSVAGLLSEGILKKLDYFKQILEVLIKDVNND